MLAPAEIDFLHYEPQKASDVRQAPGNMIKPLNLTDYGRRMVHPRGAGFQT